MKCINTNHMNVLIHHVVRLTTYNIIDRFKHTRTSIKLMYLKVSILLVIDTKGDLKIKELT